MSSLTAQLALLRPSAGVKDARVSLLFDATEAAALNTDAVHSIGLNGLYELGRLDEVSVAHYSLSWRVGAFWRPAGCMRARCRLWRTRICTRRAGDTASTRRGCLVDAALMLSPSGCCIANAAVYGV